MFSTAEIRGGKIPFSSVSDFSHLTVHKINVIPSCQQAVKVRLEMAA